MPKIIQIVLVDDEQIQLDYMRQLVEAAAKSLSIQVSVQHFLSEESFLFALDDHPEWDLAFLDIEMHELNGMEVARIVREKSPQLALVFATAFAEYAVEGYEVQALDYLLKPINPDKVKRVLARFLSTQPEEARFIIVDIDGEPLRIELDSILYVEANKREVVVRLVDDAYNVRMSLSEFANLLDNRFITTHRSYYVNIEYISQLLKQDVQLTNGEMIPLSRRLAKETQAAFIEFYRKSVFYDE